jgi:nucleotide-binding universal stress UspA family protein
MTTIVSLVDFSDVTARVLKETELLGKALGARVVLVHVLERQPMVVDLGIASPTIMQDPSDATVQKDRARLDELCQSLAAAGVSATAEQWPDESADQVVEHIRQFSPGMVVVGSHHHGALFKLLVGGLGSDLLKKAPCPVLVVPAETAPA